METLTGRTALITGAASGIGLALVHAFVGEGARVVLTDIDEDRVRAVADGFPDVALAIAMDCRDRAAWASCRTAALKRFGAIDILVNNAGIGPDGRALADMDPEVFDRLMAINLTGVFNGVRTFARDLRDQGSGHVLNTASMAGLTPIPYLGAYSAAKCAVVGLSEALRGEMAPHGVGVSVLCPGLVQTRLRESTIAAGSDVVGPEDPDSGGLSPQIVAAQAITAIKRNDFYVLTHPQFQGAVARRSTRLDDAFSRAKSRPPI